MENQEIKVSLVSKKEEWQKVSDGVIKSLKAENESMKHELKVNNHENEHFKREFELTIKQNVKENVKLTENIRELLKDMDVNKNENEVKKEQIIKLESEIEELKESKQN